MGNYSIPLERAGYVRKFLGFHKRVSSTLSSSKRERGISWEILQCKRASSRVEERILWFLSSCGGSLGFLSSGMGTWGTCSCFLREVRSLCRSRGAPWDSSHSVAAGMNRVTSQVEAGTSGFLSISDMDLGVFPVEFKQGGKLCPMVSMELGLPLEL